jgi:hypothetical protein
MAIWFKCDARFYKDPKIVGLQDDTTRYAFLVIIGEAKYERSGGVFESRQHLEACLPNGYVGAIDSLLRAGLLVKRGKRIAIKAWDEWQVDPTSTERSRRARSNGSATVEQRSSNATATVMQRRREEKRESENEKETLVYKQRRNFSNGQVESIGQIVRRTTNVK